MAIEHENKPVDPTKNQKRRGYADIGQARRIRAGGGSGRVEITPTGTKFSTIRRTVIETDPNAESGFYMRMNGPENAYEFVAGLTGLIYAALRGTGIPESDVGGAELTTDSGESEVKLQIQATPSGTVVALSNGDETLRVGIAWNGVNGHYAFAEGLPTSASGLPSGAIYNDGGTLKIVT